MLMGGLESTESTDVIMNDLLTIVYVMCTHTAVGRHGLGSDQYQF